jgi:hypothetical protein
MKRPLLISFGLFAIVAFTYAGSGSIHNRSPINNVFDSLPLVLGNNRADLLNQQLRQEAALRYEENQLPSNRNEWDRYRNKLRDEIIKKAAVIIDHQLPFNLRETGSIKMNGYTIRNIAFQTRPGVYATANLYVPEGNGPFPAVIYMHGHWTNAKSDEESIQPAAHSLASNGYVCLAIDAFGAGERSTIDGTPEYHGSNLGASLMNVGESLMGFQISDNMRAVDLICALPYVDKTKIGATGASGGGNQTMWLTAMDDRIMAAVPVVSVGTFESYVMQTNCICELFIDGLTHTEEAGVLALTAPRAIKLCNHRKDEIPTFLPAQMLKSYSRAKSVFELLGVPENISYRISDTTHGYWADDRSAMLGWFDLHLKGIGNGEPKKEVSFQTLPSEKLMVYPKGQRPADVVTIEQYCKNKGKALRNQFLSAKSIDVNAKRIQLAKILRFDDRSTIKKVNEYSTSNGWNRIALELSDGKLIPLLHHAPQNKSLGYVIVCNSKGKTSIPDSLLDQLKAQGPGIVVVDLSGTGEASSILADTSMDDGMPFHTVARAELWLGKTVLGEWAKELNLVTQFVRSKFNAKKIVIDGSREAGLAALFLDALKQNIDGVVLRDAPISYLFDSRQSVDYFSMAIHLPGFLNWGDVSLATALSGKDVTFVQPVTMSGNAISNTDLMAYKSEYEKVRKISGQPGRTIFK